MKPNTAADFWKRVDRQGPTTGQSLGPCWVWKGRLRRGYGRFDFEGKEVQAHRFAYEQEKGPIPFGLVSDHLCRNRACVRPSHQEAVTQRINILRGTGLAADNHAVQECPQGHPYDTENTYTYDGRRYCRACMAVRSSSREKRSKRWLGRAGEQRERRRRNRA